YMELLRHNYDVTVGISGSREIDFVAEKSGQKMYVQVCYLLASEETVGREFGVLEQIRDNFPKYVLSMDDIDRSRNGIIHKNIVDFLLEE
ncbi:MAG: ATPase, partial [Treponema sp.]